MLTKITDLKIGQIGYAPIYGIATQVKILDIFEFEGSLEVSVWYYTDDSSDKDNFEELYTENNYCDFFHSKEKCIKYISVEYRD